MTDAPLISVRGEAVLEVDPEIAQFSVHVQARDADRRRTLDLLTERNQRCLEAIRSYGEAVEKVETSGLAVQPILRDRPRNEKVNRYQGAVRINVTISDFAVLGELVTVLGDQELTTVFGPWWSLRPSSEVYRRARHQAAQEAVTRAKEYAEALGCRLTGLVELADEGLTTNAATSRGYGMAPQGLMQTMAASAASEPPPIDLEPAVQTVRASVEARFTATAPDDFS